MQAPNSGQNDWGVDGEYAKTQKSSGVSKRSFYGRAIPNTPITCKPLNKHKTGGERVPTKNACGANFFQAGRSYQRGWKTVIMRTRGGSQRFGVGWS